MMHQPGAPQMSAAMPPPQPSPPPPDQRNVPRPPPPPGIGQQPRTWDSGPPEPHQYDLPPEPIRPPTPEAPPPSPTSARPKQPAPPPIMAGPAPPLPDELPSTHPADGPPPEPNEEEPPVQETSVTQESEAQTEPEAAVVHVTNEQVARFSEKLEEAIGSGLVTPAMFAEGFIKETSPETTLAIVQAIGPDQLVDAVAQQPGAQSTAIVTREGRKFVQELWVEATQKATQALQGAASEEEG